MVNHWLGPAKLCCNKPQQYQASGHMHPPPGHLDYVLGKYGQEAVKKILVYALFYGLCE